MTNDQLLNYLKVEKKNEQIVSIKNFQKFGDNSLYIDYYIEKDSKTVLSQSFIDLDNYYEYINSSRMSRLKSLLER